MDSLEASRSQLFMVMEDMQILEEPTELSLDTHKAIGFTALLSILDNGCMLF